MKLGALGLAGLLLLTGCGEERNFACDNLNRAWYNNQVLLSDLPSTFADKTNDQWIRWQKLQEEKEAIEAQMDSLEKCWPTGNP